jgi:hypothetical protein
VPVVGRQSEKALRLARILARRRIAAPLLHRVDAGGGIEIDEVAAVFGEARMEGQAQQADFTVRRVFRGHRQVQEFRFDPGQPRAGL